MSSTPDPERVAARQRGVAAEHDVALQLEREGWQICARNWRGGGGELDLIVRQAHIVRFVEVKLRSADHDAEPVSRAQVQRLRSAARAWLSEQAEQDWHEACFWLVLVSPASPSEWILDPF